MPVRRRHICCRHISVSFHDPLAFHIPRLIIIADIIDATMLIIVTILYSLCPLYTAFARPHFHLLLMPRTGMFQLAVRFACLIHAAHPAAHHYYFRHACHYFDVLIHAAIITSLRHLFCLRPSVTPFRCPYAYFSDSFHHYY